MARRKKQNEDESPDNTDNADDTFGLPEIEYEPLNREEASEVREEESDVIAPDEPEKQSEYVNEEVHHHHYDAYSARYDHHDSAWPKVLAVFAVIIILAAAGWFFFDYWPKKTAAEEKARQERADAEAKKLEDERRAAELRNLEEQRKADSLANLSPKEGSIETLNDRTGRYYVVIASSIDGDLVMDYAKKLSPKGVACRIIPPHGRVKFYRLAIAEGDTYESTQETANGLKGEYGEEVWVAKY
jgi:hypothetical protein